ncbi:MAG: hypothetical protein AB7P20_26290 [Rhizobiaceae bacterium]
MSEAGNISFHEFRCVFAGCTVDATTKRRLSGVLEEIVGPRDRKKRAELIAVAIENAGYRSRRWDAGVQAKQFKGGEGHEDVAWAVLYWLHLNHSADAGVIEIEERLLGGSFADGLARARRLQVSEGENRPARPNSYIAGTLDVEESLLVKCPASLEEYDVTWRICQEIFPDSLLVDLPSDRELFKKNPYAMVVLLNKARQIVGFCDVYHLPEEKLDAIIHDTRGEVDLDPRDGLSYPEACRAQRAYIGTMVVTQHEGLCAGRRTVALLHGMCELLLKHQFHGTDELELWTIGSEDSAENLLRSLPFRYSHSVRIGDAQRGAYRIKLTKEKLREFQDGLRSQYGLRDVRIEIDDYRKIEW